MSGIIDSHVHRYPVEVFAAPAAWAAVHREPYWAKLVKPEGLQGWADKDRMLRDMDAAGIEKAVIQGWYWENQSTCDEANRWHIRWVNENPDRFIALACVQPREGKRALECVKIALDAGCSGVGELHPWVQGWSLESDTWAEIAELCSENNMPVCFHATETVGRDYPGNVATPLNEYVALAKRFPALKIVLAHWGGGLPFFMLNKWTHKTLANVYFDTAASPLLYDNRVWKMAVELAGADKILFGSDYPLRIYPKQQNKPDFELLVAEARKSLPSDAIQAVMHDNASTVYERGLSTIRRRTIA